MYILLFLNTCPGNAFFENQTVGMKSAKNQEL